MGEGDGSDGASAMELNEQDISATLLRDLGPSKRDARLSISRVPSVGGDGGEDMVAPFGSFFRAESFVGFDTPDNFAGDAYDSSQHRITFIWDFGDSDYTKAVSPNIPLSWRSTNVAYGRQVAHVWDKPGRYTITCIAVDSSGNWAKANLDIIIKNADAFYARSSTFCVSQAGDFTDSPAGAQLFKDMDAARDAISAFTKSIRDRVRLLVRSGEVFENTSAFDFSSGDFREYLKSLQVGTFGGRRPAIFKVDQPDTGLRYSAPANRYTRRFAISDIEFLGPWKSATETGLALSVANTVTSRSPILIHRCRFSGFSEVSFEHLEDNETSFILSDSEITNWANYGIAFTPARMAVIGCDIHQHAAALNGINQGTGDQRATELGNRHGPFRGGGSQFFCSCTSWFSRSGWSSGGEGNYIDVPPTVEQVALRFDSTAQLPAAHVIERCSFEGGWSGVLLSSGIGGTSASGSRNFLLDKVLIVGASGSLNASISVSTVGVTVRNTYIFRPDVEASGTTESDISVSGDERFADEPVAIYNVSVLNELPKAKLASDYVSIRAELASELTVENNIIITSSLGVGGVPDPIGYSPVDGFVPRHKGARWNFPPIGGTGFQSPIAVTERREGASGELEPGTVAVGEWIRLEYPDFTGLCDGHGFKVGQESVLANASQFHQVSITDALPKRMSPASAGGNGKVLLDFTKDAIRIQNLSDEAWTSGNVWVLLDLSDYLMDFKARTRIADRIVLAPLPRVGSSAIGSADEGLWAFDDFTGRIRADVQVRGAFVLDG